MHRNTLLFDRDLRVMALCAAVVWSMAAAAPIDASDDGPIDQSEAARLAVIRRVTPTVVAVYGEDRANGGSAVLIDPAGLALTNFHVADAAGSSGWAGTGDGRLCRWSVVGVDPGGDLALIQLESHEPFAYATLGDSDAVHPGQWVLAMGNPFGLSQDMTPSVSLGIVSAVHRYQGGAGGNMLVYGDCIQVDSSINPGNSGGPLFDLQGRLIGINGRASFERRGRVNVGVGYAISINQCRRFVPDLLATKIALHGTLGVTFATRNGQVVCNGIDFDLDPAIVTDHGMTLGDRLISFDGHRVQSANEYLNLLTTRPADWPVEVIFARGDVEYRAMVRLSPLPYESMDEPTADEPEEEDEQRDGWGWDWLPVRIEPPTRRPGRIIDSKMNRGHAQMVVDRWYAAVSADAGMGEDGAVRLALTTLFDDEGVYQFETLQLDGMGRIGDEAALRLSGTTRQGDPFVGWFSLYDPVSGIMPRLLAFSWPHLNEDAQPVMSHYASSDRTFSRQPPTDPFAQPIIEGDARCVKIIGAAVGEQPPYATGIIISEDGMILTVGGALLAADRLRIVTADGHVHSGSVIRRTTSPDLALLKIDAPCKRYFDLADAVEPAQGQWVVALTHAFRIAEGDEPLSANAGIVCGWAEVDAQRRAQRVTVSGWLLDTIVSNPGSGGGAVIDRSGRLVGMVGRAMVARHTGTALNYMIGVDRLRTFVQGETAADTSADSRTDVVGELGIVLFTLAGRSAPAYVDHVRPGSPAHAAGVRPDDLVVAIDGQAIATIAQYEQVAATWRAGQSIALSVQRAERIISVTVRARPAEGSE